MDDDALLRRIAGRRTCTVCQSTYNVHANPPERLSGTHTGLRKEDRPVVEHYRHLGRLVDVDGDQSIGEIGAEIVEAINRLR